MRGRVSDSGTVFSGAVVAASTFQSLEYHGNAWCRRFDQLHRRPAFDVHELPSCVSVLRQH